MHKNQILLFILMLSVILLLWSTLNLSGNHEVRKYRHDVSIPDSLKKQIQDGDVILRKGNGVISDVFRQFNLKDKRFSHAGIISVEQNAICIYHILGGETTSGSQLRREALETFCSSDGNNDFAIYRYNLSNEQKKKMTDDLKSLFKKGIKFDSHFDLATDSALYCTELIYKITNAASGSNNYLPCSIVNNIRYVAPDNLYLNEHAQIIYTSGN